MSRQTIPARKPGLEVTVGWDPPLATFFGQVRDPAIEEDEGDPIIHWVGASYAELPTVDLLVEEMARYAVIAPGTVAHLVEDMRQEGTR